MRAVRATPWLVPALLTVPVLVVLVAGVGWWSARGQAALSAARVFISGQALGAAAAADGTARLHLRVLGVSVHGHLQLPQTGCISVEGIEPVPNVSCTNDAGVATFNLVAARPWPADGVVRFVRQEDSSLLAQGQIRDFFEPSAAVVRRGGQIRGRREGALEISVGLVQGVLAIPFAGRLRLDVEHQGAPIQAALDVSASGALPSEQAARTDPAGRAAVNLQPQDYAVELSVTARAETGSGPALEGSWLGLLPVVPGASWATIEGDDLVVRSPVARGRAYVDLARAGEVLTSLDLPLQVNDPNAGIASARWPLGSLRQPGLFAVVSSEPDLQSMALVGWPLPLGDESVSPTWDLRPRLVVDGVAQSGSLMQARRRRSALIGFVGVGLGALLEAGLFWMLWRRVNTELPEIASPASGLQRLWLWGLVLCLLVGLLGLGFLRLG